MADDAASPESEPVKSKSKVSAENYAAVTDELAKYRELVEQLKVHLQPHHFPPSHARWLEMHALVHPKPAEPALEV